VESAELAGAPTGSRATPASVVGGYFVQVGAYSDPANAQRVRAEVAAAGPVAMDVRQTASGVELFRVRIGPWASREEADAARRTLNDLGYADSVVASR
jgi:cell division protein FtsN